MVIERLCDAGLQGRVVEILATLKRDVFSF